MTQPNLISRFVLAEKLSIAPAQLESILNGLELIYGLHFGTNTIGTCLFNECAIIQQIKSQRSQSLWQAQIQHKKRMNLLAQKYALNSMNLE